MDGESLDEALRFAHWRQDVSIDYWGLHFFGTSIAIGRPH